MTAKKLVFAIVVLFSFASGAMAREWRVTARVVEKRTGKTLDFVKVTVADSLGAQVYGGVLPGGDNFKADLKDGKYKITVSCTGHKSQTIGFSVKGAPVYLGKITLEIGEEIAEAAVSATSLLRRSGDRISYNVQKDPDAVTMSMAEMMKKIPGLGMASSNGKLEFNGVPVGEILLDDDRNPIVNTQRQYPMRFIQAAYMEKIELVLPGSLEYNNERPILLVSLYKKLPYGFAGELSADADTRGSYSPDVDAIANTPYMGFGLNYNFSHTMTPSRTTRLERESLSEGSAVALSESESSSKNRSNAHTIGLFLFRRFFNNNIEFKANFKTTRVDSWGESRSASTYYSVDGALIRETSSTSDTRTVSPMRFNAGVSLRGSFGPETGLKIDGQNIKTGRRKYSWALRYAYNDKASGTDCYQDVSYTLPWRSVLLNGQKEHKAECNIDLPGVYSGGRVKLGAGYYDRHYCETAEYFVSEDQVGETPQTDRNRGYDYRQRVAFVSGAANGKIASGKWGYLVLLQGEYVGNRGTFMQGEGLSPLDYKAFNLIPNISLSRSMKRGQLSASYSMLVKRPNVAQLNPYIDETNPDNRRSGNPDLRGSLTHVARIGFSSSPRRRNVPLFGMDASYSHTGNSIAQITELMPSGVSYTTYKNVGTINRVGIGGSMMYSPSSKFNMNAFASLGRTWGVLPSVQFDSVWQPSFRTTGRVSVKGFDIMGMLVLSPTLSSMQSSKVVLNPDVRVMVSRFFEKIRLGFSLEARDLLHSASPKRSEIIADNFVERRYADRLGRNLFLHVYWSFGKFRRLSSIEVKAYDM